MSANPARGEADLKIGSVSLTIAVTFAGLAKLSKMTDAQSLDEVYRRLIGFEPLMASCALKVFAVDAEGPAEADRKAMRAIEQISAADEADFRAAFEHALTAHFDKGKMARGEKTLGEVVGEAFADAKSSDSGLPLTTGEPALDGGGETGRPGEPASPTS